MNPATDGEVIDLRTYLAVLRVRKWTIIVTVLIVAAAGFALSARQVPTYSSQARLLVKSLPTGPDGTPTLPNLRTQGELIGSEVVGELVRDDLDADRSVRSILSGLAVSPVSETEVIAITYTSEDPRFAQQAANSFALNYIDYRRQSARRALESAQQQVQTNLEESLAQLEEVTKDLRRAEGRGDEAVVTALESQRTSLAARIGLLQQRAQEINPEQSIALGGGEVIEPAALPTSPASPNHLVNGLLGAMLGLLVGVGLAFLKDRLDDRFRGRPDIEQTLQAPVLATVPRFRTATGSRLRSRTRTESEPVVSTEPRGAASEAYRTLRTNLQFIASQKDLRSILITSPAAAEGKTVTTTNLGLALSQAGQRVILVSADLRRPSLERYFGLERDDAGLSSWLIGEHEDVAELIKDPDVPNVRILPSGAIPHNPTELLASPRLGQLMEWLTANADYVLIDSTPTLAVADASIIAASVQGAVIVVDASKTHRSATTQAKQELERAGSQVIGVVLNAFDPSSAPYHHYYPYYYRYYRQYSEELVREGDGRLIGSLRAPGWARSWLARLRR